MNTAPTPKQQALSISDRVELHAIEERKKFHSDCAAFAAGRRNHYGSIDDNANWKKWNDLHDAAWSQYEAACKEWHKTFAQQIKRDVDAIA